MSGFNSKEQPKSYHIIFNLVTFKPVPWGACYPNKPSTNLPKFVSSASYKKHCVLACLLVMQHILNVLWVRQHMLILMLTTSPHKLHNLHMMHLRQHQLLFTLCYLCLLQFTMSPWPRVIWVGNEVDHLEGFLIKLGLCRGCAAPFLVRSKLTVQSREATWIAKKG